VSGDGEGVVIYLDDVPDDIEAGLREVCLELPDAYEEQAWKGTRWMVRKKTFAHVLGVVDETGLPDGADPRAADPDVVLSFRAAADELDVLRNTGHPFFYLGWGRDAMGMVLDADTDWDEVRELVTESYCVLAPKKLIALIDRPPAVTDH
jgi:predicted DNA-binding protein (MmcQ/YjbR family)